MLDLIDDQIFINNESQKIVNRIISNLSNCNYFLFNTAFIQFSGAQILFDYFEFLKKQNIKGKILTTNYLNSTNPHVLKKILEQFTNIEIRVYDANQFLNGLHAKTYIFKNDKKSTIIIGSSNITKPGLQINHEWNLEMVYDNDSFILQEMESNFNKLWAISKPFDFDLFKDYKSFNHLSITRPITKEIELNYMQINALKNLKNIRDKGAKKAIAIAATGTGKTLLSAWDIKNFGAKKVLYIAHRREILDNAMKTFKNVFSILNCFTLNDIENNSDSYFVFDTIQTLNKKYKQINKNMFDYIVVDEAHHCAADSYQKILEHFNAKFILGLTATPERFDGRNIFSNFDNNIVMNIRLKEALDEQLLCSFNYFGVSDLESIDLSKVDISKVSTYEKKLMVKERVDLIAKKIKFYQNPSQPLKCLAFCASVNHAEYMSNEFNKLGFKAVYLSGENKPEERLKQIKLLENGEIEIICCRDVFNEGVDIPQINTILMLRPTESPTIFIQQLGRGLRKYYDKESVTVIDFIGNHKNVYNLAFSFEAEKFYDKKQLIKYVENDFEHFSKYTYFYLDPIAKNEILKKIEGINFNSLSWLVTKYQNFKKTFDNVNKIPLWLDYLYEDQAPDIIKFVKNNANKSKTYYSFLTLKDVESLNENLTIKELNTLKTLESFLPLIWNYEYEILKHIFYFGWFDLSNFKEEIFVNFNNNDFKQAIDDLNLKHLNKKEKSKFSHIVEIQNDKIYFTKTLKDTIKKPFFKDYINQLFEYGLKEYYQKTKFENINKLVLFEKYTRQNILKFFNWNNTYSSSVTGVLEIKNNFLLFVNIDKNETKNENIKYKDYFKSNKIFIWESQNATKIDSEVGQNLINHIKKGISIHLFVRRRVKDNEAINKISNYYYLGLVNVIDYQNEKPIQFTFELNVPVSLEVYKDLNI